MHDVSLKVFHAFQDFWNCGFPSGTGGIDECFKSQTLFGQGGDFVAGFGASLQQYPAVVVVLCKQLNQLGIGIVVHREFADVNGLPETALHKIEVVLQSFALQVFAI